MEEGTRKKQKGETVPTGKNTSTHTSLSSYCTSSSHSSWLQQCLSQWAVSQTNCSQIPAECGNNNSKNLGKGWEGSGDKNGNPSAWYLSFTTHLFPSCLLSQWWRLSTGLWKRETISAEQSGSLSAGSPFTGGHERSIRN